MSNLTGQAALIECDRVDMGILGLLRFLDKQRQRRTGSKASYSFPRQCWLAQRLGVRRETVCRHVARLRERGILKVTHRRKVQGFFQSCLYTIVRFEHWGWFRLREALRRSDHHVTKSSLIVPSQRETTVFFPAPEEIQRVRQSLAALIRGFELKRG